MNRNIKFLIIFVFVSLMMGSVAFQGLVGGRILEGVTMF